MQYWSSCCLESQQTPDCEKGRILHAASLKSPRAASWSDDRRPQSGPVEAHRNMVRCLSSILLRCCPTASKHTICDKVSAPCKPSRIMSSICSEFDRAGISFFGVLKPYVLANALSKLRQLSCGSSSGGPWTLPAASTCCCVSFLLRASHQKPNNLAHCMRWSIPFDLPTQRILQLPFQRSASESGKAKKPNRNVLVKVCRQKQSLHAFFESCVGKVTPSPKPAPCPTHQWSAGRSVASG